MRAELLSQALEEIQARRGENQRKNEVRRRQTAEAYPEIGGLLTRREALISDSFRRILEGKSAGEDLPERMECLSREIRQALIRNGLPENYLDPIVSCALCGDSGYVGDPVRTRCACVEKRYQELLRKEIGLPADGSETFETYDENLLPAEPAGGMKYSQRFLTNLVRKACEEWADAYPDQRPRDMVLSGQSGLGKTFLLHAMAARLIERGVPVILLSAWTFLNTARKSYFGEGDELRELLEAPVLMLDDLGSEPLMQNITVEQLFNLINERQGRNLPTVISTNLTMEELRLRYTERVISRLSDQKKCNFLRLMGQDLRNGRK